jgi:murein DD-endopeptidase MepM/ murein hydrolase activator NlpD
MSNRVAGRTLKVVLVAGVALGSASLAGCSSFGGLGRGDVTGSVSPQVTTSPGAQAMPATLQPISTSTTQTVAEGKFTPPENIGGSSGGLVTGNAPTGSIQSTALPPLTESETMSAQPSYAPLAAPKTASLGQPNTPAPALAVVPENAYIHVIAGGESLYTIARHYDVTAQAIVQANGMSSPDKIFVGQKLIIPGRADLLAKMDAQPTKVAAIAPVEATPKPTAAVPEANPAAPVKSDVTPTAPAKVANVDTGPVKVPGTDPAMSGADKFRWPVSGKVITDFLASKGTGINIDAPEGSAVRAAENGTVIYVGSGVEGYGNLILIRHPNGYVSAYAHLKSIAVAKGATVSRGDNIGQVGMTGSVSRPQLHFELRMGATPVDPIPLLAG